MSRGLSRARLAENVTYAWMQHAPLGGAVDIRLASFASLGPNFAIPLAAGVAYLPRTCKKASANKRAVLSSQRALVFLARPSYLATRLSAWLRSPNAHSRWLQAAKSSGEGGAYWLWKT